MSQEFSRDRAGEAGSCEQMFLQEAGKNKEVVMFAAAMVSRAETNVPSH